MNTYTLRCGEVVPLGMECAWAPLGRESATWQWKRVAGIAVFCGLIGLVAFNPVIQDWLLPDVPIMAAAPVAVELAPNPLVCRP